MTRPRLTSGWIVRAALLPLAAGAVIAAAGEPVRVRGSSPLDSEQGKVVTVAGAVDPHGAPGQCEECHVSTGSDAAWALLREDACLRCHPQTNFHLVDVAPEEVTVPPVMLLPGGKVTCETCHDEPACDGLPRDARGVDHFRDGPYPSPLDLCFHCHERQDYQQTDPHRDLRTEDGRRNDAVCVFCHQGVPESEQDQAVETLQVGAIELCKGCHSHQIHVGIPSHLVIASPEVIARVEGYNRDNPYPMPLGPRGEITCTSCHDPHPGLEPLPVTTSPRRLEALRRSNRSYRDDYYLPRLQHELDTIQDADGQILELADGPRNKDGLLRVPAEDGTLCLICHDQGGH